MTTFLSLLPLLLLLLLCSSASAVVDRQSLAGSSWTLTNTNGSIHIPATVPGVVHLDLLRSHLISDPYTRYNTALQQWVAYEPRWNYSLSFTPHPSLLNHSTVELCFDGIDTVADIYLNAHLLASTANMFRRVTLPIQGTLHGGVNHLSVVIHSPVLAAAAYHDEYPYDLPVSDPAGELPYRNYLRKAQSDSGWDWGPVIGSSGIWKGVELRGYDDAVVVDWTFIANHTAGTTWHANVTAYVRVAQFLRSPIQGVMRVAVAGVVREAVVTFFPPPPTADGDFVQVVSVLLTVSNPTLWYPITYGSPHLYPLTLNLTTPTSHASLTRRVGFRTIRVVREQIPPQAPGRSMFFEVNGIPIFAKGSNLVPFDAFHPRVTTGYITRMMDAAVASNQNIIRIWGGGIFQDDAVYEYADEHGILLWQEFLFACGFYSVDDWFLRSVREEVTQAVRRLASHASLAIFGGNNENEAALNWQQETITYRDRYLVDYNELYIDTVRDALVREVGSRAIEFQASSPSNGPFTLEPYTLIWGNAYNDTMGDNHWYNYDADCSEATVFPRSRFISEFGFQSFPSFITWRPISEPSDWQYRGNLSLFRQHHDGGQDQMEAQIRRHFLFPNATNATQLFDDTLYMTQVQQAFCYSMGIQVWRRIKDETPGNTMGIIYWQLNDIWQAPTWASLEYGGRWKVLHSTLRHVFAPSIVSGYVTPIGREDAALYVYAVSDAMEAQKGSVEMHLRLWSTGAVVYTQTLPFTVPALTSVRLLNSSVDAFTAKAGGQCAPITHCFLQLRWMNGQTLVSESVLMLGQLAPAPLMDPKIRVQVPALEVGGRRMEVMGVKEEGEGEGVGVGVMRATVVVSSVAPAAWVWMETETPGWFTDNAFTLLPGDNRTLEFVGYEAFQLQDMQRTLKVRSVWDVTHRQ